MKSSSKIAPKPPKAEQCSVEDVSEFEKFKDEQFTNHRKSQLNHRRHKQKSIKSLSVYTLVNLTSAEYIHSTIDPPLQSENSLPDSRTPSNREPPNDPISPKHHSKLSKEFTLLRYSRNEQLRAKDFRLSEEEKELVKSSQKINLIRKILDLYNAKSVERTYYSNLINNLGIRVATEQPQKTKSVTIKKIHPKNSFRKNVKRNTPEHPFKVGQLNMHGFDLAEEYYNHSSITLEAQGMNELIRDFLERKRQSKSTENSSKNRPKVRSNQEVPKEGKLVRKNQAKFESLSQIKAKMLENMGDNSVNHKVNKFREFLFLVNFGSSVYRQLDILRYEDSFKIYVGKGNNSNLIKCIIKKRFWFEVTKSKEEAHFVWTQLKEEEVYTRQEQEVAAKKVSSLTEEEVQLINPNSFELKESKQTHHTAAEELLQSSSNLQLSLDANVKLKQETKLLSKGRSSKLQINSTHLKILTPSQNKEYNQILGEFIIRKKYKFSDRLKYIKDISTVSLEQMKTVLIHNHLPLNGLLGNKKAMFYMLREYYRLTDQHIFATVPLTYHIKKGFLDEEFKAFLGRFHQQPKDRSYWIIKPGEFSNRGQGITCTDRLEDIKGRIANLRKLGKNKSLILQSYITNPLLYNGRKFDIRTFMLVAVNNGRLRGYWYQDGYVRTSSSLWTLENIGDSFVHLTNDAIQKHAANYGKYEPGNKLTYSELQRYLDGLPKTGRNYSFQSEVYPFLKQVATDAVKATFPFLSPSRKGNNFEIFGFDFMIDSSFKPWLIEINTNPCLEMTCPVLERIIPSMVENAFRIAVDPIFPPPLNFSSVHKYNIPENALHYNKFELIFDEDRDGPELRHLYASSKVVESIDEYEQDKQTYEEEGEEVLLVEP